MAAAARSLCRGTGPVAALAGTLEAIFSAYIPESAKPELAAIAVREAIKLSVAVGIHDTHSGHQDSQRETSDKESAESHIQEQIYGTHLKDFDNRIVDSCQRDSYNRIVDFCQQDSSYKSRDADICKDTSCYPTKGSDKEQMLTTRSVSELVKQFSASPVPGPLSLGSPSLSPTTSTGSAASSTRPAPSSPWTCSCGLRNWATRRRCRRCRRSARTLSSSTASSPAMTWPTRSATPPSPSLSAPSSSQDGKDIFLGTYVNEEEPIDSSDKENSYEPSDDIGERMPKDTVDIRKDLSTNAALPGIGERGTKETTPSAASTTLASASASSAPSPCKAVPFDQASFK